MSIDLDWLKLDASLSTFVVTALNKQLSSITRPSFIGPIEVTSLDFGTNAPDVELVDMRDIYRDFLDDEDEDNDDGESESGGSGRRPVKVTETLRQGLGDEDDDEGFEWVSRRAAGRAEAAAMGVGVRLGNESPSSSYLYARHVPQHLQHYGASPLGGPGEAWSAASPGGLGVGVGLGGLGSRPGSGIWESGQPLYRSPTPSTPFTAGPMRRQSSGGSYVERPQLPDELLKPLQSLVTGVASASSLPRLQIPQQPQQPKKEDPPPPPNPHPNLQLHFQINWQSNLRITITTSLLINYPSPMFMSLPIKLSVTGLIFSGEIAVAYEGERRRVHLCLLDDLDPYGPAGDRSVREQYHLPSESTLEVEEPATTLPLSLQTLAINDLDDDVGVPLRPAKPLPVGQRLLPSIIIESEIGQADKHVLKNVTRVERFIQDVIRKTVVEELVFPNFHTLVMGDQ